MSATTQNDLTLNEVKVHDVLQNGAIILALTKVHGRKVTDVNGLTGLRYSKWVSVCYDRHNTFTPFISCYIYARPDGIAIESGAYCKTLDDAMENYSRIVGVSK